MNTLPSSSSRYRRAASRAAMLVIATGLAACADNRSVTRPTAADESAAAFGKGGGSPHALPILFSSNRDGNYEIYSMNPDGSNQTRLTFNRAANDNNAVWSPNGNKILFYSTRDNALGDVYVMNANGTNVNRLTNTPGASFKPSWSPDGNQIVFMSTRDAADPTLMVAASFEIYKMNADGTGVVRITNNTVGDLDPVWSPDGKHIAFVSDRDHPANLVNKELYLMNTDGTNVKRLTNQDGQIVDASWDLNSARLAYTVLTPATNPGIYILDVATLVSTRLTFGPGVADAWPSFSPDGTQLAFAKYVNGSADIYLMKTDGSGQTKLTTNAANDSWPRWSR